MFSQIRTSKNNKDIVSKLTKVLNLGTENIIARLALSYSIAQNRYLDLETNLYDNGGKEYSKSVLLGEYEDIYIGLICLHYDLYKTDKRIPKYIKMHIDDGLYLLDKEIENSSNIDSLNFILSKID